MEEKGERQLQQYVIFGYVLQCWTVVTLSDYFPTPKEADGEGEREGGKGRVERQKRIEEGRERWTWLQWLLSEK